MNIICTFLVFMYGYVTKITSHVIFFPPLSNIIMNNVSKIYLNQHFKV